MTIGLFRENKNADDIRRLADYIDQSSSIAAASQGCRHLILGTFGCSLFGNDAAVVSDSFYRAITKLSYAGKGSDQLFASIDFAVLCRPEKDYNYREFCRYFLPVQL